MVICGACKHLIALAACSLHHIVFFMDVCDRYGRWTRREGGGAPFVICVVRAGRGESRGGGLRGGVGGKEKAAVLEMSRGTPLIRPSGRGGGREVFEAPCY